jgi:hypothetical protein
MNDLPDIRHLQTQSTDHHWRLSAEHPKEENRYIYRKHGNSSNSNENQFQAELTESTEAGA